ncbi:MAG: hypothetical protein LBL24_08245 [Bacteroidales bacterium]|nr:hypothetical protein [Bacteroidales bacterium]
MALGQSYISEAVQLLITPMLIAMSFETLTGKELNLLRRVMIGFFIVECGLSIVEWTLNRAFFLNPNLPNEFLDWFAISGFFRSTSLLGHPLANAQVVAVFMTFIAISDFKKKYVQIFLFFLGYLSLFCFNARGATLVITAFVAPYFIWKVNRTTPQNRKWIIKLGVFCVVLGIGYMVTQTSFGGRLMNMELMDSSGQTRLEVWDFYRHYDRQENFIWGHPGNYLFMMDKLGAAGVENGVVCLILDWGIVFTIPVLLLLFRFQYHRLSVFSKFDKWLLLAVFYIIGFMNPNLAAPLQWTLWIYAYYVFRPQALLPQTETVFSIEIDE